jgi:hypothetical protein
MALAVVLTSCADELETDLAKCKVKAMEADGSSQTSGERLLLSLIQ